MKTLNYLYILYQVNFYLGVDPKFYQYKYLNHKSGVYLENLGDNIGIQYKLYCIPNYNMSNYLT